VVDLNRVRVPLEGVEHVGRNLEDLGVRNHSVVGASNVEIALVEFPHATFGHCRLVATIHLGDLVAFEALHTRVHGEPTRERDSKIVTQRAEFTTLVLQVVDEF
jgi:hypothetical protein